MIVWKLKADGAFVAADTATGFTAYAYPTSASATQAKRAPYKVAVDMMRREIEHGDIWRASKIGPDIIANDMQRICEIIAL